jgi:hypothetical protein
MFSEFHSLRDESTAVRFMSSRWQRAGFFGVVIAAVALLLLIIFRFISGQSGHYDIGMMLIVAALIVLAWWLSRKITLSHELVGFVLMVNKSYEKSKVPLKNYPREYDLRTLCAAQKIGEMRQELQQAEVQFVPPKLVLVYDALPGRHEQVVLKRPYVRGPAKELQSLQHQLDSWNKICAAVENQILPESLALRWRSASLYERYWLMLLQAEVEFLQGESTSPQMFLATIRSIINIIRRGGILLGNLWIWLVFFYLAFGLIAFGSASLGFRFFIDDKNNFKPHFGLLLLPTLVLVAAYYIVSLFEPLSGKVRKEMDIRMNQARRLIKAGVTKEDLEPVLSMVEHEIDRVKHALSTLTVATALPVLLTSLPKFFGTSTSRISDVVLVVSIVAFAVVQLYYFTQVRILHIAETSCLIARSDLDKVDS